MSNVELQNSPTTKALLGLLILSVVAAAVATVVVNRDSATTAVARCAELF